jgi:hypothetical protein
MLLLSGVDQLIREAGELSIRLTLLAAILTFLNLDSPVAVGLLPAL